MKINNRELYSIFYSTFITYWFIGLAFANLNYNFTFIAITLLGIGTLAFSIMWLKTKFTKKELLFQLIFAAILGYAFYGSGSENIGILTLFPAIVGLKNIKIRDAAKVMFMTLVTLFIITLVLCALGIIPIGFRIKIDSFDTTHSMVMIANQHGNSIFAIIFALMASGLYAYYDKIKRRHLILLEVFIIILYILLASRTGLMVSTLLVIGCYYSKFSKRKMVNKYMAFLIRNSFVIFYGFVFFTGKFLVETKFYRILNSVVSSRISEVTHYLNVPGVKLLPQYVRYNWICDNTQIKVLASYGVIFTLIYLVLTYITIKKLQKENKKFEIFLMILFMLYSYSEVTFFKPISDFTFLFLAYAFKNLKIKDRELIDIETENQN